MFWAELLENGVLDTAQFFNVLDDGAKSETGRHNDMETLQDQIDIGLYFSAVSGLSNVLDATATLELYKASSAAQPFEDAMDFVDTLVSEFDVSNSDVPLMQLVGILDVI